MGGFVVVYGQYKSHILLFCVCRQKERDELRVKYEGPDKKEEETLLILREEALREQAAMLMYAAKKESKRTVLERYEDCGNSMPLFVSHMSHSGFRSLLLLALIYVCITPIPLALDRAHTKWNLRLPCRMKNIRLSLKWMVRQRCRRIPK